MKLTIKIKDALDALQKNLAEHITEYDEARTTWVTQMHDALNEFRGTINRKGVQANHERIYKLIMQRPVDLRAVYSKHIGALELAEKAGEDTFQIDEDDYDQMFNDNWSWARQGRLTNSTYSATAAGKLRGQDEPF